MPCSIQLSYRRAYRAAWYLGPRRSHREWSPWDLPRTTGGLAIQVGGNILVAMPEPGSTRDLSRIPTASMLREPILETFRALGGKATNEDLERGVAERVGLSAEDLAILHDPYVGTRTEFAYRMAWARTRLKKDGRITKVATKLWSIASEDAAS